MEQHTLKIIVNDFVGVKVFLDNEPFRHHLAYLLAFFPHNQTIQLTPEQYTFIQCLKQYKLKRLKILLSKHISLKFFKKDTRSIKCYNHCSKEHKGQLCAVYIPDNPDNHCGYSVPLTYFYSVYDPENPPPLPNEPLCHDPITSLFLRCLLLQDEDTRQYILVNTEEIAQLLEKMMVETMYDDSESIKEIRKSVDPFVAFGTFIRFGSRPFIANNLLLPDPEILRDYNIKELIKTIPDIIKILVGGEHDGNVKD